jgi:hypothetical protein
MCPFSSTHLDSYYLDWPLWGSPHVLNVGTSTQPYFVSYTHQQLRCYISLYTPQVCEIAGRRYWKSQSKGNNAGYICHGKRREWICCAYLGYSGSSDGGGVQDIAREQPVREMAHQESKVLSPRLLQAATQSTGCCPLVNLAPNVDITPNNQPLTAPLTKSTQLISLLIGLAITIGIDTYRRSNHFLWWHSLLKIKKKKILWQLKKMGCIFFLEKWSCLNGLRLKKLYILATAPGKSPTDAFLSVLIF